LSGKTDHRGSTFLRKRDGTTITYSFDGLDRSIQKNVPASSGGAAAYSVSYK
jgi:YD repeat-containing protein